MFHSKRKIFCDARLVMNFSLTAKKLRAKIAQISGEFSHKLDKTARRFVTEAVYGILRSKSILLTDIGRTIEGLLRVK
jgi:hypothetical protein